MGFGACIQVAQPKPLRFPIRPSTIFVLRVRTCLQTNYAPSRAVRRSRAGRGLAKMGTARDAAGIVSTTRATEACANEVTSVQRATPARLSHDSVVAV